MAAVVVAAATQPEGGGYFGSGSGYGSPADEAMLVDTGLRRPTTPCMNSRGDAARVPSATRASSANRSSHVADRSGRRFEACGFGGGGSGDLEGSAGGSGGGGEALPPRPTTPCMNRGGDAARRRRGTSARSGSRGGRPHPGSIGARMSELESALLARAKVATALAAQAAAVPAGYAAAGTQPVVESWSGRRPEGRAPPPAAVASGPGASGTAANSGYDGGGSASPGATAALVAALGGERSTGPRPGSSSVRRPSLQAAVQAQAAAAAAAAVPPRPSSSCGHRGGGGGGGVYYGGACGSGAGALQSADPSLLEEAKAMCRGVRSNLSAAAAAPGLNDTVSSPRYWVDRPSAPTPEQTNHWLQGLSAPSPRDRPPDGRPASPEPHSDDRGRSHTPVEDDDADDRLDAYLRPRSPTPTKMLAWEEQEEKPGGGLEDSDHEGRGDQTDGLISRLIEACQMNDVSRAFAFYEKLRAMRVHLYEGVYKMIIECCMRTQQLGHAMQFYESLKGSGQRVSARLVLVLIEACAREQHGDKVHAIWLDWCPEGVAMDDARCHVLLETVGALIRTMSPDLAQEVLVDAMSRPGAGRLTAAEEAEVELEELVQLNETVADEARMNGTLMGELAECFGQLHCLLEGLRAQSLQLALAARPVDEGLGASGTGPALGTYGDAVGGRFAMSTDDLDDLLMEDLDLDLDLAAM